VPVPQFGGLFVLENGMNKKCSKCGKEKPIDEFPERKDSKDSHRSWCIQCDKERHSLFYKNNKKAISAKHGEYYKNNKTAFSKKHKEYRSLHRQEAADYQREYLKTQRGKEVHKKGQLTFEAKHPGKFNEYVKKYRSKFPERIANYHKKYAEAFPNKYIARVAVSSAVLSKKLPPIKTQKCSVCKKRQAQNYHHHLGYEKDHWLDVIPVCSKCHKAIEKNHTDTN
jgi:hypothetical protein